MLYAPRFGLLGHFTPAGEKFDDTEFYANTATAQGAMQTVIGTSVSTELHSFRFANKRPAKPRLSTPRCHRQVWVRVSDKAEALGTSQAGDRISNMRRCIRSIGALSDVAEAEN